MVNGKNKILIVDDEAVIRELMTDILTDEGYAVESVASPIRALDVLRDHPEYVLLFTDIMMPDMDGIQLIREARKIRPTLIPIVMTGFATLETARAAVKEGAYDYVLKPFSLGEIKLAVSNALERYNLANENARLLELTELFNISENIAAIRDESLLLNFVLKAALDRVSAERGSLMITTPDGKTLEVATSIGVPDAAAKTTVQVGSGISGWVAQNAKPLLVGDIQETPDLVEISRRLRDPSFISVPLERKAHGESAPSGLSDGQRVIAVMNVTQKKGGGQFTESDLKILSIVANHASVALENVRLIRDIQDAHLTTLESMALLLEAKDAYTHGHSQRVSDYSVMAAKRLGMNEQDVETLRLGAALHDIGKIGVKDSILNKTEKLTQEEWELIKQHPVIGYDVLAPVRFLTREHLELVRSHHERLDGSGYPDGLKAEDQSLKVRIIAVADSYDAMTSSRAYRRQLSLDYVASEIKRCAEKQFDPKVAELFIKLMQDGEIGHHTP
ncbi:MAG: response regulator [Candidatus Hydrogenedentes bacterium]|nr:response regulator [Candidatus Hydrogenedentota bacterium]